MKIAIDVSPLKIGHFLQHRVRGTGFYLENLKRSLLKYYPDNQYIFFTRGKNLPKDIDLVHYPYFEPFFLTLPFLSNFRTVVTVHDLTPLVFPKNFPRGIRGELKWQLQKLSLKKANGIIADSISSKNDIIKHAGISEDKTSVVYLAAGEEFKKIQSSKFRVQSFREKYNLPEKFVLYVGDVTWNKNLPRLIEAVKSINVPLAMVGKALVDKTFDRNNFWNQDLIKIHELIKDDKKILRLGFVPTDELVMIYNLATVFAMPSLYEGFGLPILEAMSCGCPVVSCAKGSIPEIAGDAAHYVDPYSFEDIAEGIKKVFYNNELQKNLSSKGLKWVKGFTWRKTTEKTIGVYEKVLKL